MGGPCPRSYFFSLDNFDLAQPISFWCPHPINTPLVLVAGCLLHNTLSSASVHEALFPLLSGPACLHASTASMYAWPTPQVGWMILCLIILLFSNFDVCFDSFLYWAFSPFLLSLFLANKYAQEHVWLHKSSCRYLGCVQILRDEVRGKIPPVYEEVVSETQVFVVLNLLRIALLLSWWLNLGLQLHMCLRKLKIHRIPLYHTFTISLLPRGCTFCIEMYNCVVIIILSPWIRNVHTKLLAGSACLMSELRHTLKALVGVKHDTWAVTGMCTSHCLHEQRPASPPAAYDRTLSTRSSLLIQGLVMLLIQFKMYCFPATVLARLHCIKFDIVLFTSSCVIPLDNCCHRCFISKFDQHIRVLGPCLMALELHLWMLGKVYFLGRAGIGLPGYIEIQWKF